MKCPVCKIELEIPLQDLDEVYYDCSNCDSSLLFKNGECEVLSEGKKKTEVLEKSPLQHKSTPQQDQIKETTEAQDQAFEEESSSKIIFEEDDKNQQADEEFESFPESHEVEEAEDEDQSLQENQEEEEDLPGDTTQVPELSYSEEELSQNFSEQEEVQEQEDLSEKEVQASPAPEEEEGNINSSPETDFPFEKESEDAVEELEKAPETPEKEDFSEVAEFGNTQDQDRQGPFLYDLTLSEINSQNVREKVLSILEDKHLNLPLNAEGKSVQDSIKDGQITVLKISPVQAYVILTSLMGLPLDISWKQHHIAESSSKD